MALGRLFLFSFLISLPQAESVMGHGGYSLPHSPSSDYPYSEPYLGAPRNPTLAEIAEAATMSMMPPQDQAEVSACQGVEDGLSCACQAFEVLKKAGIPVKPTAGVNDLVSQLEGLGWVTCEAQPGAVGYTKKEEGRSHIGVLDKNTCVTHNSGAKGGKLTQTPIPANNPQCQTDSAGLAPMNKEWAQDLNYLCPPF